MNRKATVRIVDTRVTTTRLYVETRIEVQDTNVHGITAPRDRCRGIVQRWRQSAIVKFALCGLLLLLPACSFSRAQPAETDEYRPIRSPYPTFTPTPALAAVPGAESADAEPIATVAAVETVEPTTPPPAATEEAVPTDTETPPPAPTAEPTLAPPRIVVSAPLVNVRAGPGTGYPILTTVERGEEFDIVGKNSAGDWWRFCCVDNEPAWVIDELVEAGGAVDTVAVSDAVVAVPPTATSAPVAAAPAPAEPTAEPAPAEPTEPPAPSFSFELQNAEQFPENKLVRVFLYVFDSEQALAGYSVRVRKDGGELPVSQTSMGGQPSLTWPIADSRQRFQNMKVEFPGVAPGGTWEVQLIDGGGNPVGPPATFALDGNDDSQELYVRYKKL